MRKVLTIIGVLCCLFCPSVANAAADNKPLENTEFQVFKAETQLKLDTLKENQSKDIAAAVGSRNSEFAAQNAKIDAHNKTIEAFGGRISDLAIYIALAAIIITVLAIGASLAGFFTAKTKAKETAETWFKENENGLLQRLQKLEADVAQKAALAHSTIERTKQDVIDKGAEVAKSLSLSGSNAPPQVSPDIKASLTEADTALKDKPESQYTYADWNTRAHAAYANNKLALAAELWGKAAQTQDASDENVAKALVNQGAAYSQDNQTDKALVSYAEVISRFGASTLPALQEPVAKALVSQGFAYGQDNQTDKALASYAEVINRFGASPLPALQEQVAKALVNQGITYVQGNQVDKALASYAEVISRFGASPLPALQEPVAKALVSQGFAYGQDNQTDKALASYAEVINRFGASPLPALQEPVAKALVSQGFAYGQDNQTDKALASYAEVISRFGASTLPALQEQVASAKNGSGFAKLLQAKQVWNDQPQRQVLLGEALVLFEQAIALVRDAINMSNQAYSLWLLGRADEAASPLREALRMGGEPLRDAELGDAALHTVAEDAGFVALVNRLWDEVKPK